MDLVTDEEPVSGEPPRGADVAAELAASGALDSIFAKIDAGELELTGDGGFVRYGHAPEYLKIAGRWQNHLLFQVTFPDTDPHL